jgi:A/G-specific adenine glycosylase
MARESSALSKPQPVLVRREPVRYKGASHYEGAWNPSDQLARVVRRRLLKWWTSEQRELPWRSTRDPYRILIAELLLQQTRFSKVLPAYDALIRLAPTPHDLAALAEADLLEIVRPLGLVGRAGILRRLGQALEEQHGGRVPRSERALVSLPGVGPYAARAVRCFAYGAPEPLVDRLTFRFYRRFLGLPDLERPARSAELWQAVRIIMSKRPRHFHLAVIDFTSLVCRSRDPQCTDCTLADFCAFATAHRLSYPSEDATSGVYRVARPQGIVAAKDSVS